MSGEHLRTPIRRDIAVVFRDRDHVPARLGRTGQPQLVRPATRESEPRHVTGCARVEPAGRAVGDDDLDLVGSRLRHDPVEAPTHLGPRLRAGHDDRQAHRSILAAGALRLLRSAAS